MRKLSRTTQHDLSAHVNELRSRYEVLEQAIQLFNETLQHEWSAVDDALHNYNMQLDTLRQWREDQVEAMDGYLEERSEKWQDSEGGQAYQEWRDMFENLELDDIELDGPEEVEMPDIEAVITSLEELPEAPGA